MDPSELLGDIRVGTAVTFLDPEDPKPRFGRGTMGVVKKLSRPCLTTDYCVHMTDPSWNYTTGGPGIQSKIQFLVILSHGRIDP